MINICSIDQSLSNTALSIFEIEEDYFNKFQEVMVLLTDIKNQIKATQRKKINESKNLEDFYKKIFTGLNSSITSAKKRDLYLDKLEDLNKLYEELGDLESNYKHIKTFSVSSKKKATERIIEINNEYLKLIKEYNTEMTVMEGYALGIQKSSSVFDLGELGGVLKLSILTNNNDLMVVPPNTLKLMFSGIGKKKKEAMETKYLSLLEEGENFANEMKNDDEIDSYALGYIFCNKEYFNLIKLFTLFYNYRIN